MKQPIEILKGYFEAGDYPTQEQFADLIDSFFHKNDTIPVSSVENAATTDDLTDTLDAANRHADNSISNHNSAVDAHADIRQAVANAITTANGYTDQRAEDIESRLAHDLGAYTTPEELIAAHPTANVGDMALVMSTDTVWTWSTSAGGWVDTDKKGEVTDAQFQAHVNNATAHVTAIERNSWNNALAAISSIQEAINALTFSDWIDAELTATSPTTITNNNLIFRYNNHTLEFRGSVRLNYTKNSGQNHFSVTNLPEDFTSGSNEQVPVVNRRGGITLLICAASGRFWFPEGENAISDMEFDLTPIRLTVS